MFCSHGFTSTVKKSVVRYMQVTGYNNNFVVIKWPMLPFLQNNNNGAQNVCEHKFFCKPSEEVNVQVHGPRTTVWEALIEYCDHGVDAPKFSIKVIY
jgi:hypothetical protein